MERKSPPHAGCSYSSTFQILKRQDPKLRELVDKFSSKPDKHARMFKKHVVDNWKFNTTLLDLAWFKEILEDFDIGGDSFKIIGCFEEMPPLAPKQLFD